MVKRGAHLRPQTSEGQAQHGLDVSVKETSVCIVDDTGGIVREAKLASEPEALTISANSGLMPCQLVGAADRYHCANNDFTTSRAWCDF